MSSRLYQQEQINPMSGDDPRLHKLHGGARYEFDSSWHNELNLIREGIRGSVNEFKAAASESSLLETVKRAGTAAVVAGVIGVCFRRAGLLGQLGGSVLAVLGAQSLFEERFIPLFRAAGSGFRATSQSELDRASHTLSAGLGRMGFESLVDLPAALCGTFAGRKLGSRWAIGRQTPVRAVTLGSQEFEVELQTPKTPAVGARSGARISPSIIDAEFTVQDLTIRREPTRRLLAALPPAAGEGISAEVQIARRSQVRPALTQVQANSLSACPDTTKLTLVKVPTLSPPTMDDVIEAYTKRAPGEKKTTIDFRM